MRCGTCGTAATREGPAMLIISWEGTRARAANVPFHFKQTGANFRKDGRLYNIPRNQQMKQAHKAGIDYAYK